MRAPRRLRNRSDEALRRRRVNPARGEDQRQRQFQLDSTPALPLSMNGMAVGLVAEHVNHRIAATREV